MGKGMRHRAIDRKLGADADGDDHEAKLVVQAVGKHPPHVVLDHREEDRESRHQAADENQQIGPGETARQCIDGELGGEGRQHDRTDDGRLGIGILKPAIQQRERRLDAEGDKNHPCAGGTERHAREGERPALAVQHRRACKQKHSGSNLHDQIAHRSPPRPLCTRRQDQEDRGDGGRLPPDEQRHEITGMKRGDGRAGIGQPRHVVGRLAFMPAVKDIQRRRDMEHDGKRQAEMVGPVERHLETQHFDIQVLARTGRQAEGGPGDSQKHHDLPRMMRNQHKRNCRQHHQRAGWQRCQKITHHRNNPPAAWRSSSARCRQPR